MRMPRHIVLALSPVVLLASCDPFDLVEPRPPYRQHGDRQQPQYDPRGERGPRQDGWEQGGSEDPRARPNRDGTPVPQRYPIAQRTDNPDQVISPFAPFNVIDVSGYNSGQLVRDPTNNEIFRIP